MNTYDEDCWRRHHEWCDKIDGYLDMNRNQKKAAKKNYSDGSQVVPYKLDEVYSSPTYTITGTASGNSNWAIETNSITSFDYDDEEEEQEKENTMDTSTRDQRYHLNNRARTCYYGKQSELQRTFGLTDDNAPNTAAEMVKRIQDGMFVLPKDEDQDYGWDCIRWRDPAKKTDKEGFKTATEKLTAAYAILKDDIEILAPEQGLASFRTFETATFN